MATDGIDEILGTPVKVSLCVRTATGGNGHNKEELSSISTFKRKRLTAISNWLCFLQRKLVSRVLLRGFGRVMVLSLAGGEYLLFTYLNK
jgi:hypothetical protein